MERGDGRREIGDRRPKTGGKAAQSEEARLVVKMYQDGVPTEEIRAKLRIGSGRMFGMLKDSGTPMRARIWRGGRRPGMDPEKLRQAVEMYQAGEYMTTIKRSLHVSEYSIYQALRAEGVPLRHGNKQRNRAFSKMRPKRAKRTKQTTTNIVMLQKSCGEDFVGLANGVLAGELAFRV